VRHLGCFKIKDLYQYNHLFLHSEAKCPHLHSTKCLSTEKVVLETFFSRG
jgi:hypothetical protein